ncbi:hypothetical protein FG877_10580 [Enterococcus casseliflavus]|nr:hypothetical protein [Enterococcus casseliflavus]
MTENEIKKSTRIQMTNLNKKDLVDQKSSFTAISNHAKQQVDKVIYASVDIVKKKQDREKKSMQDLNR